MSNTEVRYLNKHAAARDHHGLSPKCVSEEFIYMVQNETLVCNQCHEVWKARYMQEATRQ